MIIGPSSGKVIFVDSRDDVFIFPLKMLGYSLNSVEPSELEAARQILLEVAPHLYGLDSNTYGQTMADGTAAMTLGWTGPLGQELKDTKDKGYVVPSEGTAFWLDTWVMLTDAPDPEASYAWLNFIQRPGDPGRGDELQPVRDAQRRGQGVRQAGDPRGPGDLPAGRGGGEARGPAGHLQQHPAQRHLGRVQVEDRRVVTLLDANTPAT